MDRLGIGLIGCGNISSAYLRLVPIFTGMEVRAVADLDMSAARQRGEEFGIQALPPDELLASEGIDVVVNLTVPSAHYQVSKQCLEAGKHVYSEKPLTLSLEEGQDLLRTATGLGLRVGAAPDTFLGGAHQLARACIDEGLIGDVVSGTSHVMSHGMEHWHPNPEFFFQPGGGPILDVGPYYITNLIQFIGPVRRVAALAGAARPTRTVSADGPFKGSLIQVNTPTSIHALLEFVSGAMVTLGSSWDVWAHRHGSMELYGTDGSLFIPDPNFFGGAVEYAGRDGSIVELAGREHPFGQPNSEHHVLGPLANYRAAGLADMVQAIATGRPHRCSIELAIHAVDVMTSILKAAECGAWMQLSSTCSRPEALDPQAARSLMRQEPQGS